MLDVFIFKRNKEEALTYSIKKQIECSNGKVFNVGDIVKVVYKSPTYSNDAPREIIGRLSQIRTDVFNDRITIDGSGQFNSNTEYIDVDMIINLNHLN